jgi:hypothetical protein
MSKKNSSSKNYSDTQSPTSKNYTKNIKNKAIENSPYGKDEPSTHTKHK